MSSYHSNNISSNYDGGSSTTSLSFAIPYTVASGSLCLFGIISNLFVMLLLAKHMKRKKNMEFYVFSSCLSGFFYSAVFRPGVIAHIYTRPGYDSHHFSMIHGQITVFFLTSTLSLFMASFDKYLFIAFPLSYARHITKSKTVIMIALIWLGSISLGILWAFESKGVSAFTGIAVFFIFISTILVHVLIFVLARTHRNRITRLHRSVHFNHPIGVLPGNRVIIGLKASKTLLLMLIVYICSWLPTTLYRLHYLQFGGDVDVFHKWVNVTNMLVQVHTCINPLTYTYRSQQAKLAIQKSLFKNWPKLIKCCFRNVNEGLTCSRITNANRNNNDQHNESTIATTTTTTTTFAKNIVKRKVKELSADNLSTVENQPQLLSFIPAPLYTNII